jgi:hypothetical protein
MNVPFGMFPCSGFAPIIQVEPAEQDPAAVSSPLPLISCDNESGQVSVNHVTIFKHAGPERKSLLTLKAYVKRHPYIMHVQIAKGIYVYARYSLSYRSSPRR